MTDALFKPMSHELNFLHQYNPYAPRSLPNFLTLKRNYFGHYMSFSLYGAKHTAIGFNETYLYRKIAELRTFFASKFAGHAMCCTNKTFTWGKVVFVTS